MNSGKKVYMKCLEYYHNLEDKFQRDFEGGIFKQVGLGKFILSKYKLTLEEAIKKAEEPTTSDQVVIFDTKDFKVYINGYIVCFTLIPKQYVEFSDNKIIFNYKNDYKKDFYHFLNMYTNKYTYISVYEAKSFMEMFYRHMTQKGYNVEFGIVNYEDFSQEKRLYYYRNKRKDKLIFTKDNMFSYQREFRVFVEKLGENTYDHIEEEGVDLRTSVVKEMVYLSPDYVRELKLNESLDT